jgi:hypothetical protein
VILTQENLGCYRHCLTRRRHTFYIIESAFLQGREDYTGKYVHFELGIQYGGWDRHFALKFGEVGHVVGQGHDGALRADPDALAAVDAPILEFGRPPFANPHRSRRAGAHTGHAAITPVGIKAQRVMILGRHFGTSCSLVYSDVEPGSADDFRCDVKLVVVLLDLGCLPMHRKHKHYQTGATVKNSGGWE